MAAPFEIYFLTFNCARTLIDAPLFASHLFQALPKNDTKLPDVIAISLQEIAPIAYSFLGGSWIAPYLQRVEDAVQIAGNARLGQEHGHAYERLLVKAVGMTIGMTFVKTELRERVNWIQSAGVGVGLWEMGNKGACGMRVSLDESEFTFVAAHLAPSEGDVLRRNQDWENIVRGLVFEDVLLDASSASNGANGGEDEAEPLLSSSNEAAPADKAGIYKAGSIILVGGDFNYRTSHTRPDPETYKQYPQPANDDLRSGGTQQAESQWSANTAHQISVKDLLERDQLTQERVAGRTFQYFSEMPIHFSPTYKYDHDASDLPGPEVVPKPSDAQTSQEAPVQKPKSWNWAKHRWPSWCDRILFIPSFKIEPQEYTSLPLHASSDHRAVALSLMVRPGTAGEEDDSPKRAPFPLNPNWKAQRTAARRKEIAVGVASYLLLTIEGNAILVGLLGGALGGYVLLRSLI